VKDFPLVDLVGVGLNATDTLIPLEQFPQPGSKVHYSERSTRPGGQVATTVVACQTWGLSTRYVGKLGDDDAARLHKEAFARVGTETQIVTVARTASLHNVILIDAAGERTVICQRNDLMVLQPSDLRREWIESARVLHVDGHDTAHKAAVLAALAYGFWVPPAQLYTEGLRAVEKQDIIYARKLGYGLKLLAIIKTDSDGAAEVRVHPTLVPTSHVLASVSGVFNAVLVRGDVVGDTLYYGRGAGGDPTASSVVSDLAQIAAHFPQEQKARNVGHEALHSRVKSMPEIVSRYYLRLMVVDRPGVLADVARVLADRKIGISSVIQPEAQAGEITPLVLMLHDAPEAEMLAAVQDISTIGAVKTLPVYLRVEDFD